MKMVKSLLLGSAAGLVAVAGAQAADLPVKAAPVQYVKICSLYGAGFYYIPGTDTCIKIGGYVRAEWNYQAGGSFNPVRQYNFDWDGRDRNTERTRGGITVDVRSQTAYGTLRGYAVILPTATNGNTTGGGPYVSPGVFSPALFIQFAGFTFGKTASFFDFNLFPYSNQTSVWGGDQAGNGIQVLAYTAQFGGGFSASISAEDETSRRSAITGNGFAYQGRRWPDVVANLRVDQAWGSAQIMGAIHDTTAFRQGAGAGPGGVPAAVAGATDSNIGYAIGAGLRINLPSWGKGDYVIGQINYASGATNYLLSNSGAGGTTAFAYAEGAPILPSGTPPAGAGGVTNIALGPVFDAVGTSTGNIQNTKGWMINGGYEHVWNPQWKTSIYAAYGALDYSTGAAGVLMAGKTNADWTLWQIGSRTVWTPVPNLDLSLEVLYTDLNKSAFDGTSCAGFAMPAAAGGGAGSASCTFDGKGFVSAIFRAQRNFWP